MARFSYYGTALILCTGLLTPTANALEGGPDRGAISQQIAGLQDELEGNLRAGRPGEFAFIAFVVRRVENGRLSLRLVRSLVAWAKNQHPDHPFPYFRRALLIIAP